MAATPAAAAAVAPACLQLCADTFGAVYTHQRSSGRSRLQLTPTTRSSRHNRGCCCSSFRRCCTCCCHTTSSSSSCAVVEGWWWCWRHWHQVAEASVEAALVDAFEAGEDAAIRQAAAAKAQAGRTQHATGGELSGMIEVCRHEFRWACRGDGCAAAAALRLPPLISSTPDTLGLQDCRAIACSQDPHHRVYIQALPASNSLPSPLLLPLLQTLTQHVNKCCSPSTPSHLPWQVARCEQCLDQSGSGWESAVQLVGWPRQHLRDGQPAAAI